VKFKEQSFFLSSHPQFKIESAMKYLYEHGLAFPVQCLSVAWREREKRSVILPVLLLLRCCVPDMPVCYRPQI